MYKNNYNVKEFGERIKDVRKKNKMTQEELAEKLFLSVDSISKMENGKVMCMPEHLTKICQIFNVSADYFYFAMEKELVCEKKSEIDKITDNLKMCSDFDIGKISRIIQIMLEQPAVQP